ncbi:MAG: hypothetical protein FJW20_18135 [Acidimicrobiia bacterium]|nr:hypothetical protein [Acidimicrobiia bacterium]
MNFLLQITAFLGVEFVAARQAGPPRAVLLGRFAVALFLVVAASLPRSDHPSLNGIVLHPQGFLQLFCAPLPPVA